MKEKIMLSLTVCLLICIGCGKKPSELSLRLTEESAYNLGNEQGYKDGFSGFVLDLQKMKLSFNTNGRQGKSAKFIHFPINAGKELTEYEMYALKGGIGSVRKIIVAREYVRGRYKYYVQLTIKGEKPQKNF